ncbi:MAG: GNAT family N-acetyltransferase [Acidobacteriota bacterium]|nr:MAG: GNAT family N-acetyltransferase [Acidobacteriota bacterium]
MGSSALSLEIRTPSDSSELSACVALQQRVWGFQDSHLFSASLVECCRVAGGTLIGAWLGGDLVGFALTVPAVLNGELIHHSHMLAVLPGLRNQGIGRSLKEAQRQALRGSVDRVTWTFDPLESRNANLNFNKLGVRFGAYYVNFYGEETGSDLHAGLGTDRFLVVWDLEAPRLPLRAVKGVDEVIPLIRLGARSDPITADWIDQPQWPAQRVTVEIPPDIQHLKKQEPSGARNWREMTRKAFTLGLKREYSVSGFLFGEQADGRSTGAYLLEQRTL